MYYLLYGIFYLISLLPMAALYGISDAAFLVIYHILGYRKDVVRSNLTYAFPAKSPAEIERIMRRFYRSFCDQWIEAVKLLTISPQALSRRMKGNWDVLQQLASEGKNTYLLTGHTFNWEWANAAVAINTPQTYACVYLPLSSVRL